MPQPFLISTFTDLPHDLSTRTQFICPSHPSAAAGFLRRVQLRPVIRGILHVGIPSGGKSTQLPNLSKSKETLIENDPVKVKVTPQNEGWGQQL